MMTAVAAVAALAGALAAAEEDTSNGSGAKGSRIVRLLLVVSTFDNAPAFVEKEGRGLNRIPALLWLTSPGGACGRWPRIRPGEIAFDGFASIEAI